MPNYELKTRRETIGERLRKRREKLGLSIKDVAKELQTSHKFIQALEEDRYEIFSAKIYAQGFLQKMLKLLAIEEKDEMLHEFTGEWEVRVLNEKRKSFSLPEYRRNQHWLTPKRIGITVGGIIFLILFIFLTIQVRGFVSPPIFELYKPGKNALISEPLAEIRGRTEKESRLTINGREVRIDQYGNFKDEIDLLPGVNELNFAVENRFGKKTEVVRYVVVK